MQREFLFLNFHLGQSNVNYAVPKKDCYLYIIFFFFFFLGRLYNLNNKYEHNTHEAFPYEKIRTKHARKFVRSSLSLKIYQVYLIAAKYERKSNELVVTTL